MQLDLGFSEPTSEELVCIIYTTLNDEFQLDGDRLAYSTGNIQP